MTALQTLGLLLFFFTYAQLSLFNFAEAQAGGYSDTLQYIMLLVGNTFNRKIFRVGTAK